MAIKTSEPVLSVVLSYAQRGWPVLPLHSVEAGRCTCHKDCSSPGKHPRTIHGFKDATTDEQRLRGWWESWQNANVGIVTGAASGLVVIDVDPRNGGLDSLVALEHQYGELPQTLESLTGGGGRHLFFGHPGIHVHSTTIAPGVDIKADGGYVVVPPSEHHSGRFYDWKPNDDCSRAALAPLPNWVHYLIGPQTSGSTLARPLSEWREVAKSGIAEGQRNVWVSRLTGHLLRYGVDPIVTLCLVGAWNQRHNRPPLPQNELIRIVDSIAGRELRRRRGGPRHG